MGSSLARAMLFLCFAMAGSDSYLTETESEIAIRLIDLFNGNFCIFGAEHKSKPPDDFAEQTNCFFSVLSYDQLIEYVRLSRDAERRPGKSVIMIRGENSTYGKLREISRRVSLSAAVWITFAELPFDEEKFQGIYIPFDCLFIYVNPRGNTSLLTKMYKLRKSTEMRTQSFGYWTSEEGLWIREEILVRKRVDLEGELFEGITKIAPPYTLTENGTDVPGGYMYEVWKEVEHRMNFKSTLSERGGEFKIDMLNEEVVEFAVLPVAYDSSTLDFMDISLPVYESRSYLFGHRPGSELEWDSYLKPFDSETWWVTLGWMACSSLALALLYKIAWNFKTSENEEEYFIFTPSESLATVFRAMCMQGSDVVPRSNSCRLMFLSIYLTGLVVSSAFSAALFSLLTVPTARAPFNRFEDVIRNRDFKLGLIEGSDIHQVLLDFTSKYPRSIQNDLLRKVGSKESQPKTLRDGLDMICLNKMYVMMSELPEVLYEIQNMTRECQEKVMPAGPVLYKSFIGFGLKKGSPFKEAINLELLKMRNEGIMRRLLLRNWPARIPSVQTTWVRVTLSDISPILYMFAIGAVAATLLLLGENLKYLMFRKSRKKELRSTNAAFTPGPDGQYSGTTFEFR